MTEKQANFEIFEEKHAEALARIRSAFEAEKSDDAAQKLASELEEAKARNASLSEELDVLKAQRSRDVSELDTLIAQLKPLIGEA